MAPKGAKMAPKWLQNGSQNGFKKHVEKTIPKRGPRGAPRVPGCPPGRPQSDPGKPGRYEPRGLAPNGRRMSFLTFSRKADPLDLQKQWFSLSKTILFDLGGCPEEKLRKMRPGERISRAATALKCLQFGSDQFIQHAVPDPPGGSVPRRIHGAAHIPPR